MHAADNANPIPCTRLKLDSVQRAMMPAGILALLLFACVWIGHALSFVVDFEETQSRGVLLTAEVFESAEPFTKASGETVRFFSARLVDSADSPAAFDIPKGVASTPGARFQVLRLDGRYVLPENMDIQRWIGIGMTLVGLLPFFIARQAWQTYKSENARIARLTQRNERVPALALRVTEHRVKKAKSWRRVFRINATFAHLDGQQYEAISEDLRDDPSERMVVGDVQILLDRDAPRESLIASDTLPTWQLLRRDRRTK